MCGRYTYLFTWRELARRLGLLGVPEGELTPRYNVAPSQVAPVVRRGERGREGVMMRWGLTPRWARDVSEGTRNFNARSETVAEKPTFREAFRDRRCVVPISGFYEWRVLREGKKQPYYIRRRDGGLMALAGLWERWGGGGAGGGGGVETFAVLTTRPNGLMERLHDRMPVVLDEGGVERWLGAGVVGAEEAGGLFEPREDEALEAFAVGPLVSNARNEGTELIVGVAEERADEGFLF